MEGHLSRLLQTLFLLLLATGFSSPTSAASHSWGADDIQLEMGAGIRSRDGVILSPNQNGQVYFTLPGANFNLQHQHLLELQFGDMPLPPVFIFWRNGGPSSQQYRHHLPPTKENPARYNLQDVPAWQGSSTEVAIGLHVDPSQQIELLHVTLASPTMFTPVADVWRNWTSFRPWQAADINVYTGTRESGTKPHPMPVFAVLALLLLAGYALWHKLRRGTLQVDWRVAGGLVLVSWMILDVFWNMRLWQQVPITYGKFAGKTSTEKLLASSNADLVRFILAAKAKIPEPDARVVIASGSDYIGMSSAYYMSPLNTYWHRNGPELPPRAQLNKGDYILLVAPTSVPYRPGDNKITLKSGNMQVEQLFASREGALLRVLAP